MVKKISVVLAIIMLFTCVFAACGDKKEDSVSSPIVGKWVGEDEGFEVVYVFNNDGTGYSEVFGLKVDLTYEVNETEIIMTVDGTKMMEDLFGMSIDELIAQGYMSESDRAELTSVETFAYTLEGNVLTIDGVACTKAE